MKIIYKLVIVLSTTLLYKYNIIIFEQLQLIFFSHPRFELKMKFSKLFLKRSGINDYLIDSLFYTIYHRGMFG